MSEPFIQLLKARLQDVVTESYNHGHDVALGKRDPNQYETHIDDLTNYFLDLIDIKYANAVADYSTEFWRPRAVLQEEVESIDEVLALAELSGDLVGARDRIISVLGLRVVSH